MGVTFCFLSGLVLFLTTSDPLSSCCRSSRGDFDACSDASDFGGDDRSFTGAELIL